MKKLLLIVVFLMSLVAVSFAQAPSPSPTLSQPSAEDIKQAKENLKVLLSDGQATPDKDKKSVADVMDKGLDMLSGYVGTLEGVVSKFAPEVWRIMVKQQYAKAISYPLYWGLIALIPLFWNRLFRRSFGLKRGDSLYKYDDDEGGEGFLYAFGGVIPALAGTIFSIAFFYYLSQAVMIMINPEYYALKDIIQMLK